MNFCDFCDCEQCRTGIGLPGLTHALTNDGRWICDVCYHYDECIDAQRAQGKVSGPCTNFDCEHRPKIVGEWCSVKTIDRLEN